MTPPSHSALAVGIDIGTTSVKAVAADEDGTVVARARVPHRLLTPQPDQAVANFALSGEQSLDTATAFSAFPLFDGNVWDEAALAERGARPDQFPPVVVNGAPAGKVGGAVLGASSIDAMGELLVAGAD